MTEPTSQPRSFPQSFFQPPAGACQILLVRHGQSEAFVEGRPFPLVDGQGDPPLSVLGRFQAEALRDRLRTEPIDAIYASNLQRTSQTMTPLAEAQSVLTRLQRKLTASLFMHDNKEVFVTFSAGVTALREAEPLELALERADEALYEAKRTGKNRTCIG